jgi:hypothetical protein
LNLRRIVREPLLHFLLVGLALFVLFDRNERDDDTDRRVVVGQSEVAGLVQRFQATWNRVPTDAEIDGLIDWYVREEILYREGVDLGLDRDDPVIKRRVRQKMDVMLEESREAPPPTDDELAGYLQANADKFSLPATVSFTQVYLGSPESAEAAAALASHARAALASGADPAELGRPTLLPPSQERATTDIVSRDFGPKFVERVQHLPVGEWSGPISSSFGDHLVRVEERTLPVLPALGSVRARVAREWELDRRSRAADEGYRNLREQYDVLIDVDRASMRVATGAGAGAAAQAGQR